MDESTFYEKVVLRLKEREKELQCIYKVEEILRDDRLRLEEIFPRVLGVIPSGWQHTTICEARIIFEGKVWRSDGFRETPWTLHSDIVLDANVAGRLDVVYTMNIGFTGSSPFLPEEQKLLDTIAHSIGHSIFLRRLRSTLNHLRETGSRDKELIRENILSAGSDLH